VCRGLAQVISVDRNGIRAIHASRKPGEPFGGTFACAQVKLPYGVVAAEDCQILIMNYRNLITACPTACEAHQKLIENMLFVLAEENLSLKSKMRVVTKRGMREKLMTYLEDEATRQRTRDFSIPFNRQELADFLGVERSALSAEISKMRDEGILESERSHFRLN
jgi:CRP-like cAMP-binding protein